MAVRQLELPHILEVENGPQLDKALVTVGGFFVDEDFTDLFGVGTLHRHFHVPADRALFSTFDSEAQVVRTGVVPITEVDAVQAVQWGFFLDGTAVELGWREGLNCTPQIEAALKSVGAFFVGEDLNTILAVELLERDLQAGPGQVFLENTDEDDRSQWSTVVSLTEVAGTQPAGWRFSKTGQPLVAWHCNQLGGPHSVLR